MSDTIASTQLGRIRGVIQDGVHCFKGVRYGAVRARFQRADAPEPWTGVRDALAYGPVCPQPPNFMIPREREQHEDCLVLNIWTPALHGKRPVMVWLHGGGFRIGSGERWTRGALTRAHDVVVVTLNHRNDVFGMLHLAELCGPDYADSGNVILHDLLQALHFVRDHIASFGGDPGNVTLFGESGGGRKVSTLLAMPSARGLFKRAIVQSGSQLQVASPARASAFALQVLRALELEPKQVRELERAPYAQLLLASRKAAAAGSDVLPVVDGQLLERHPFDPDAPAISADIPMIIGTNRDENSFFLRAEDWSLSAAGLHERVTALFGGARAREVLELFTELYPGSAPPVLWAKIQTARGYFFDACVQAERKAALGAAPAYMYQFEFRSPLQDGRLGAHHALEVPFVFDELEIAKPIVGPATEAARALAKTMSTAWVHFARSGDPNHAGLAYWPAYDANRRATLLFDEATRLALDPRVRERELMATFGAQPAWTPLPV